ncbi:protein of unknown function DUF610 YibQ [Denitrovibrio acetiphilus DSM 12809]|uniref:Divergent polysaccharide deacetylase family protein n=1 Tax=Denitrovibrio acetiphilus (strain DSM 12809 / NBRC 114555 / N2460) TaxID=522772 RepID=D4H713_DENA2|nr:divergent polysaccharide deacetylase family protein [Denitrovibrio acetiphilus]ADD69717.1 protein of unknown function DUF610 YibQ [Denitrovibrio acetiphilus DSM 12809]
MPPRKTNSTRKTTSRKPAAKKTTARKPAAKKNTRRNYKRKQPDRKLPLTTLLALIPLLLLAAFIVLRFSGGPPPPAPKPIVQKETVTRTVVKEVETKTVMDTVKLFMFEHSIKNDKLTVSGNDIKIEAPSSRSAEKLTEYLKKYLSKNKITVDGKNILTAEDSHGIYNISFSYPRPVTTVQKRKPAAPSKPEPVIPPAKKTFKAKLAVVIDDCGYSMSLAKQLAALQYPATFAVIPFTPYGKETALLARKAGKPVFLHFPMQPRSYPKFDPGKGALFLNMPETVIAAVTKANFDYFPIKLDGANNHTGSAFTESREKMEQALKEISKYTPGFLDSHTSRATVAYDVCKETTLKCGRNDIFLDNEEPGLVTKSAKRNHVHDVLMQAAKKALANGSAIAIGHLRKDTISVLENSFRQIEEMGVEIVPVTSLMN